MKWPCLYISLLLLTSLAGCGQKNNQQQAKTPQGYILPSKPLGWVSDFEQVFTTEQVRYLDSLIGEHEKATSNEIAVVSLKMDSVNVPGINEIQKLSLQLVKNWGVGKKEKDNGVGIIFSTGRRMMRIEVGYGLEAKLTDEEAKIIINTIIVPEFRKADYFNGIVKGLQAVFKEII